MITAKYFEEYIETMGEVLREKRITTGYNSLETYAETIKVRQSQYGRYELGENMKIFTVLKVVLPLSMTPGQFLTEVERRMAEREERKKKHDNNINQ